MIHYLKQPVIGIFWSSLWVCIRMPPSPSVNAKICNGSATMRAGRSPVCQPFLCQPQYGLPLGPAHQCRQSMISGPDHARTTHRDGHLSGGRHRLPSRPPNPRPTTDYGCPTRAIADREHRHHVAHPARGGVIAPNAQKNATADRFPSDAIGCNWPCRNSPPSLGHHGRADTISLIHRRTRMKYAAIHAHQRRDTIAGVLQRAMTALPPFHVVVTDNAMILRRILNAQRLLHRRLSVWACGTDAFRTGNRGVTALVNGATAPTTRNGSTGTASAVPRSGGTFIVYGR